VSGKRTKMPSARTHPCISLSSFSAACHFTCLAALPHQQHQWTAIHLRRFAVRPRIWPGVAKQKAELSTWLGGAASVIVGHPGQIWSDSSTSRRGGGVRRRDSGAAVATQGGKELERLSWSWPRAACRNGTV
jgi:hypothetical protein